MRSSEQYAQRPELLKSHPIIARLLTLKQSLSTLEELDFAASDEESDIDDDDESLSLNMDEDEFDREQLWKFDRLNGLEADELDELLMDAQISLATSKLAHVSSVDRPPKKKRKTDLDSKKSALPVFDLVEPEYDRSKTSSSNDATDTGGLDAYGEATSLQHADQVDKNARKKSLRFHTSKIESASARRQGARNNAVGGDDDIPYKERRKEKDARIAKEAEKKIKSRGQGGDDLDDVEPENEGRKRERDEVEDDGEDDGEDSADGYYELVKRKTKEKKAKKKGDYEEAQAAARYISSL
jgi:U3 small nucleolar RNA-associated protein 3